MSCTQKNKVWTSPDAFVAKEGNCCEIEDIRFFDGYTRSEWSCFVGTTSMLLWSNEISFFSYWQANQRYFSPYIIRHKRQLLLKAVCPICKNAIILYDSTQDGASSNEKGAACEFKPFETNTLSSPFAIAIKYNYLLDNLKTEGVYSNQFENCFIYILDDNGKEGKALIEE